MTTPSSPAPTVPSPAVAIAPTVSGGTLLNPGQGSASGILVHSGGGGGAVVPGGGSVVHGAAQPHGAGGQPGPGGFAVGVVISGSLSITSAGAGSDPAPALPLGEPMVQDWAALARAVRAGQCSLRVRYPWITDPSGTPSGPGDALNTVMAHAWSRSPDQAAWHEVRDLVEAGLEQGASLYLTEPDRPTLDSLNDPAKLRGWLDLGGDPCAPHQGQPMWWSFIARGQVAMIDVLRASGAWPRWSRVRDDQGVTAVSHWARGVVRPNDDPDEACRVAMEVFDRLEFLVKDGHDPLGPTLHILIGRALTNDAFRSEASPCPVPALRVWETLVRDRLDLAGVEQVDRYWKAWQVAKSSLARPFEDLWRRLSQPIEQRLLQATLDDVTHRATLAPGARRRRL